MRSYAESFVKGCILGGALLIGSAPFESAQADGNVTDFYFQQVLERYYNNPTTSRVFGMAGSSNYTSSDSSAIVGNPAAMGFMTRGEASATYGHDTISGTQFPTGTSVDQKTHSGLGLLAIPLGEQDDDTPDYGNFGLAWAGGSSSWGGDSFDTSARETNVTGTYAKALSEDLSLGYSFGWQRDKLQSREIFNYPRASGYRHTLGAMFKVDESLSIGSTIFAGHGRPRALYGPGIKSITKSAQFGAGLGAQYQLDQTLFAASVDYSHLRSRGDGEESVPANFGGVDENGNIFNVRVGVEQLISENFTVRGGYRFAGLASYNYARSELMDLEGSAYYNAFTLGAGVNIPTSWHTIPEVRLDYAAEYRAVGNDDWQHVVTLSLPFSLCPPYGGGAV